MVGYNLGGFGGGGGATTGGTADDSKVLYPYTFRSGDSQNIKTGKIRTWDESVNTGSSANEKKTISPSENVRHISGGVYLDKDIEFTGAIVKKNYVEEYFSPTYDTKKHVVSNLKFTPKGAILYYLGAYIRKNGHENNPNYSSLPTNESSFVLYMGRAEEYREGDTRWVGNSFYKGDTYTEMFVSLSDETDEDEPHFVFSQNEVICYGWDSNTETGFYGEEGKNNYVLIIWGE